MVIQNVTTKPEKKKRKVPESGGMKEIHQLHNLINTNKISISKTSTLCLSTNRECERKEFASKMAAATLSVDGLS
jgi:hypothetical protein